MTIVLTLPDDFIGHYKFDKFVDSLQRIKCDTTAQMKSPYSSLSGRYETELLDALIEGFKNSK